ncbi:ATP-binding cassette domain-containing protein [Nocardia sp. NPDC051052]|uniref:ATP-binding cassette domain-containing protein n=1 Tax=Nocardia sp. NPDC051052 TaxID=3364322 RepID=UPI0037AE1AD3
MMIQASGLTKTFVTRKGRDKNLVEAVRGIDLTVRDGEIFGLLGPNGAGKTTTVRILASLLPPDGGEATVAGHDIVHEQVKVRENLGYVSQAGGIDDGVTVRDNMMLQARLCRMPRNAMNSRIGELLATLGLADIADRAPRVLSGGQKRRLALAVGLVHRPPLLFLDEPTLGLDPHGRTQLWSEVQKLRESGTTILLTTNYLDEADALCDRLAIVDNGRIVAEGTPESLKREVAGESVTVTLPIGNGISDRAAAAVSELPFVRSVQAYEGRLRAYVDDGQQALPPLLRALDAHDIKVGAATLTRPSLDDVFLDRTGRSLHEAELAAV